MTFAQTDTQFRLCLPINQDWVYKKLPAVADDRIQYVVVTVASKSSDPFSEDVQICIDIKGTGIFAFWDRATEIKTIRVGETYTLLATRRDLVKNYGLRICVRNASNVTIQPYVSGNVITS